MKHTEIPRPAPPANIIEEGRFKGIYTIHLKNSKMNWVKCIEFEREKRIDGFLKVRSINNIVYIIRVENIDYIEGD